MEYWNLIKQTTSKVNPVIGLYVKWRIKRNFEYFKRNVNIVTDNVDEILILMQESLKYKNIVLPFKYNRTLIKIIEKNCDVPRIKSLTWTTKSQNEKLIREIMAEQDLLWESINSDIRKKIEYSVKTYAQNSIICILFEDDRIYISKYNETEKALEILKKYYEKKELWMPNFKKYTKYCN